MARAVEKLLSRFAAGTAGSTAKPLEQNGASGLSDIEGKAARVAANERGQRVSFKITKTAKFLLPELSLRFLRFLL